MLELRDIPPPYLTLLEQIEDLDGQRLDLSDVDISLLARLVNLGLIDATVSSDGWKPALTEAGRSILRAMTAAAVSAATKSAEAH